MFVNEFGQTSCLENHDLHCLTYDPAMMDFTIQEIMFVERFQSATAHITAFGSSILVPACFKIIIIDRDTHHIDVIGLADLRDGFRALSFNAMHESIVQDVAISARIDVNRAQWVWPKVRGMIAIRLQRHTVYVGRDSFTADLLDIIS